MNYYNKFFSLFVFVFIFCILVFCHIFKAEAGTVKIWDGGGSDNNWSTAANWNDDIVPTSNDTVVFDGTSSNNSIIDIAVTVAGFSIDAGYGGVITLANDVTINGAYTQSAGTIDLGDNTLTITYGSGHNFTYSGGTFIAGIGSTVVYGKGHNTTFAADGLTFYDFSVYKPSGAGNSIGNISGTITVTNNFYFKSDTSVGNNVLNGGIIDLHGDLIIGGLEPSNLGGGSTEIEFTSTGDQAITCLNASIPKVKINKTGGSVVLNDNCSVSAFIQDKGGFDIGNNTFKISYSTDGNFIHTAGTFTAGIGSTVVYGKGHNTTFAADGLTFYNFQVYKPSGAGNSLGTIIGTITVINDFGVYSDTTVGSNILNTGTINVGGDFILGGLYPEDIDGGSININLNGSSTQQVIGKGAGQSYPFSGDFTVTKSGGDLVFTNGNFTIGSGVAEIDSLSLDNANLTLGSGAEIDVVGATTYNNAGGNLVIQDGGSFVSKGLNTHTFYNLTIESGGNMTHADNSSSEDYKLIIKVDNNMEIQTGGTINVNGLGYDSGQGPGAGEGGLYDKGGASYGGQGAGAINLPYGSTNHPVDLGSGGGQASGGGAIKLNVTNNFTLNGDVTADGESPVDTRRSAASGGSIWILAGSLTGNGSITANGGNSSYSGAGGGGRIDISGVAEMSNFTGQITVSAGSTSYMHARAYNGTINFPDNLTVINADYKFGLGEGLTFSSLTINNGAYVSVDANPVASNKLIVNGLLKITANSTLHLRSDIDNETINGGRGVIIKANSIQIDSGSSINADAGGFCSASGPSSGNSVIGGEGGGHAGRGGGNSDSIYGFINKPFTSGSGASGAGGGALKLVVSTNLRNDGVISADGLSPADGRRGSPAGGSIWILAGSLLGSGSISANGGSSSLQGGGGGGGHIAIYTKFLDNFSGTITANGGNGNHGNWNGENGTIVRLSQQAMRHGKIIAGDKQAMSF